MLKMWNRDGFTLVEITVALLIFAVAVLGITASATQLVQLSTGAQAQAMALQAVNDRLSIVMISPRYAALDSLFTDTEEDVPAEGHQRVTDVVRSVTTHAGGKVTDYTTVTVTVSGPRVIPTVSRSVIVGAP
jgi:prepilin-type N-terminal cleavage/methylation domain-containing protein